MCEIDQVEPNRKTNVPSLVLRIIALFDDSNRRSVCCGANSKVFIRMP